MPLAKATLLQLAERWPQAMPFRELLSEVRAVLGTSEDAATLAGLLMKMYSSGLLELHLVPSRFTLRVSERPRAFSLARLQARSGAQVTTLRHSTVEIEDALGLQLVTLLDGTRDRTALLKDLESSVDPSQRAAALREEELAKSLNGLARLALLEA